MIKGIDSQVIIQRTTEYSKEASQNTFNAEQAQEFANRLERSRAQHAAKSVNKTNEAEGGKVDRDGRNSAEQEERERKKKEEEKQQSLLDEFADMSKLSVGYIKYKIDIEV